MSRKQAIPGLQLRGGVWHINKRYRYFPGGRLRKSTGFDEADLEQAEACLIRLMNAARKAAEEGVRPDRCFKQAATKYLLENTSKASIAADAKHLEKLMPFIGHLVLRQVHTGTLQPFVDARKAAGIKQKSINNALSVVRRILNLAARLWRDEHGLTWLDTPPLIVLPKVQDAAKPYPLDWGEQNALLNLLPKHLADMALFKVNCGAREQEVCQLRWQWEVEVPELETSVFIVPAFIDSEQGHKGLVKNREDRLLVLNKTAKSVIESRKDIHPEYVFTYRGQPVKKMNNSAWKRAWRNAGLPVCKEYLKGVHNLKHTFGRRLRAAGVSLETRRVLLGHTNGDITTHYSAAELQELLDATKQVDDAVKCNALTLTLLKRKAKDVAGHKMDTRAVK